MILMVLSVILLSMLIILHYLKCNRLLNSGNSLEMAPELDSDITDTADIGRKWLVDNNFGNMFHLTK